MDHVVYVDKKAKELPSILAGKKSMIVRGATGRKIPYGRVAVGDRLFFLENDGSGQVKAMAQVKSVIHSDALLRQESLELLAQHQEKLRLTPAQQERWEGKRYLVLIELDKVEILSAFRLDRSEFPTMDDWLPVGDIEKYKLLQ